VEGGQDHGFQAGALGVFEQGDDLGLVEDFDFRADVAGAFGTGTRIGGDQFLADGTVESVDKDFGNLSGGGNLVGVGQISIEAFDVESGELL
jgi:hypothetical protein